MSAINGIFERRGAAFSSVAFSASLDVLAGYGQEGSRHWLSSSVGLGYQKTSLWDTDHFENLPTYDPASSLAITADARIDNRAELFDALDIPQTERKNLPDSRLILLAWRKWERDCPRHLIGDYAFAIWDEKRQTLFCARDHIGARPFYYSLTPERFIFASDLKGVLAVPGVSDQLDEDFVVASLADKRFYRKDRTYFAEIRRLAPGHTLTVQAETERLQQYWFPENVKEVRFTKDADYAEAAREIFTRAASDRLRTNEQVGVHLSGGLDSSSVTVLTARERQKRNLTPPVVLSWQPPLSDDEDLTTAREYEQIKIVCEQENLIPQYCPMNAEDILAVLKKDPTREPIHITMLIENTIQREAAKRGVRLILSGWGGDEGLSFDGRGYYAELLLRGRWWRLFRESRKYGSAFKFIGKEALLLLFPDRSEALKKLAARSLKAGTRSKSFSRAELKGQVKFHKIPCRQSSIHSTLIWLWTRGMLAERMESWAAHGAPLKIEYAYPLADRRLMEFVAGLPPEQFVRGKWKRWIMRQTLNGVLPPEICWQKDKGEPVRAEKGLTEIYRALELARREIESKKDLPSRAHYFDMTRLVKYLQPEVLAQRPQQADVVRALQFLDF
jgi:asparagine synthase (glutamine-hydrolysing)